MVFELKKRIKMKMRNLIEQPKITQFGRFILPLQPVLLYSVVGNCCKVPLAIGLPKDLYFGDQLPPARNFLETAYKPLQLINIKANPFSVTVPDFLLCFLVVLKWPEPEDHKISIFIQQRQPYWTPHLWLIVSVGLLFPYPLDWSGLWSHS